LVMAKNGGGGGGGGIDDGCGMFDLQSRKYKICSDNQIKLTWKVAHQMILIFHRLGW
jgi:hypothetical protein